MGFRTNIYKSPAQLRLMVEPGLITAAALDAARPLIRAGVSTLEIDAAAEKAIRDRGGEPNFMLVPGYRHTVCASVNDEVVHGIPGGRILEPGDIVSIDAGAQYKEWNGDSAITVVVPDPSRPEVVAEREQLSKITEGSLWAGIARLAKAKHLNEVGDAIQGYIELEGMKVGHRYGILTDYIGHGIGRDMHEAPPVFNYRVKQKGPEVKPGLVVAIEPMVVTGKIDTYVGEDDWTVITEDGGMASHWEHSVAVHKDGIWVLTAHDGGAAGLAPFGVVPTPIA
ncbi:MULTISPECIES: type I methionyl aminopeptidase [Aurantimicrobium]|uniref:Methionine aminopeptidase n=1 Tax=Aurantimicrobium photophilum TaxID=1987356 RepID=A0A2Z3S1A3_9MICO|nr:MULTISPECIES: type I methionyl aminopeptidase [Aurantimicrobium]AWR20828.1 Methionine aminopeptidase 1 [Aurantimicrobium photophilum]MDF9809912.1 methionyl aminopeptidase [Aurantimicrobium minutum]MDH6425272.1 methionyl aminopeptidase [Aurantimicrobium minutum]MDH6536831.1 methionyl aminopeptidase [Aurantimicrobium minutum]